MGTAGTGTASVMGSRGQRITGTVGTRDRDGRAGGDRGQRDEGLQEPWGPGDEGGGHGGDRDKGEQGTTGLQGRRGPGQEQAGPGSGAPRRGAELMSPPFWVPPRPQRVLTADFCEGCKITNVEGIRSQGLGVQDVSDAGDGGGGHRDTELLGGGGHPGTEPSAFAGGRQTDPGLRRANLLHRLHPRGSAPRER